MITSTILVLSAIWMIWFSTRINTYTATASLHYVVIPLVLAFCLLIIVVIENPPTDKGILVNIQCPACRSENLQPIHTIKRSSESDDVATEDYICLDCEASIEVHYSLQVMSVETEED